MSRRMETRHLDKKKKWIEFDPIPMTYSELYSKLFQDHMVAPIPEVPVKQPCPKWYNPNAQCEYHLGGIGHTIEDCISFKKRVQSLRDEKLLELPVSIESCVTGTPGCPQPSFGAAGHDIENCWALKRRVQAPRKTKHLNF